MTLFPSRCDDLLDVASLPPTDNTQLNYRTRPLLPEQEQRFTLIILFGVTAVITLLASFTAWLTDLMPFLEWVMAACALLLLGWLIVRRLTGAPYQYALAASYVLGMAAIGGAVLGGMAEVPVWSMRVSLLLAWLTCALLARQVATWILVGPRVDLETMRRWEVNVPRIVPHGLSFDCPELLTWGVNMLLLAPAWSVAAWIATGWLGAFWLWPVCYVGVLHTVWLAWHLLLSLVLPWPNPLRCWQMTWQALVVFITYDIHHTPAAGVFRFPTRWLRRPAQRWILLSVTLVLLAFCVFLSFPPIDLWPSGPVVAAGQLAFAALAAPVLLATILWFLAGSLLLRFDTELHANMAPDPEDPNAPTEWDNYIDRIINSADELEQEHLLCGTTLQGDYPVLLHRDIHDQHVHIVGDTGASKTSLGIAPQATQLIARADSTVVIVDLKGDRALFETCRREAARTRRMRFRWLANEVGATTFAFNPFIQSHNRHLSTDQLVQQHLQGLSLDYGLKYGAGYFTAMNEIVLGTVLKNCGARSFRELDHYLRDQDWYESIGYKKDWIEARHLGALVTRLSASPLLNVTPDMFANQPAVHEQALDVAELFEEPQVVYLSLRSSVEATNAPTIARLFLWAMFSAACHRKRSDVRVYFFLDEFQQVISDGIRLIFEQFRDMGGTIIAAHQTAGQLRRQGIDIRETVESCTAVKQVFRASDLVSQDQLEKLAGTRTEAVAGWMQRYEPGTGDLIERYLPIHAREREVRVREEQRPRLSRRELQTISSERQSSLVRFTLGSGYTQFAGATVPIASLFPVSFDEYQRRKAKPWPEVPGAFRVTTSDKDDPPTSLKNPKTPKSPNSSPGSSAPSDDDYLREFERRGREAVGG